MRPQVAAFEQGRRIEMGKIMVVDDNTVMLGFMTTLLELEGYAAEDIMPVTVAVQPDVIIIHDDDIRLFSHCDRHDVFRA